ncbi:hypothetical protein BV898_15340 [Hypsibius exemplaris]|uniref:Uncharacterized protein n=1 Tax=Hypsibius exemplaris TaxID=2072580 RepID=A0A9X6NAS8_HYPEX|nr:hypothetical protein BV898_15340 [Hypsibius exemplaris]
MGLCNRVADIIHAANCDPPAMVKRLCRICCGWENFFMLQPAYHTQKSRLWDVPDQGGLQGVLHPHDYRVKNGVLVFRCANWRNYTQTSISLFTGFDKNTVSDWVTLVREAIAVYLRNTPVVLGGHGEVGYADGVLDWDHPEVWARRSVSGIRNKHGKKILMLLMAEQKSKRIQIRVIGKRDKKKFIRFLPSASPAERKSRPTQQDAS